MTAKSGYIQRRIIKVCEDIQVKYDGSVRDTTGKIYQLAYGDTGMDPCSTVKVDNKQQPCDVFRIVDRLNLEFELKKEKIIYTRRIDILRAMEKATGKKSVYKGISDEELIKRLENM